MFKIIFNTIIGIILLFIWSRFVDLSQIVVTLSKVNLVYLIPILFFMLASPVVRALRLKIFLSEVKEINLLDLIWLNGVALMLNFFIPIRAGEIAKGVYLNSRYKLPLGKAITWVFLDRLVDFLVVLVIASVFFLVIPTSLSITFITIIIIILSLAVFLSYLAIFQSNFAKKIVNFLRPLFIVKATAIYFERFSNFILDSFSILNRRPRDLAIMFLLTILGYAADAAIWYFTFIALGFNPGFMKMYLGQLLSALTYLIPAAPGYVGSAEASGLLILSGVFGIEANFASAMIVLFHVTSVIFILIFGIISLYLLKLNLGDIFNKLLKRK